MTNALKKYDESELEIIRDNVAKGATNKELEFFLTVCARRNLDPILKQIYWTPKGVMTSIDGLRLIAYRTRRYRPGKKEHILDEKGNLEKARATVSQLFTYEDGTHEWFEVTEEASLNEYVASTPTWRKMPEVMLKKCAEAQALRRAFPEEMGSLYATEELDQANEESERKPEPPKRAGTDLGGIIDIVMENASLAPLTIGAKYDELASSMKDAPTAKDLKALWHQCEKDKDFNDEQLEGLKAIKEAEKTRLASGE